jgi:hypothetical protein
MSNAEAPHGKSGGEGSLWTTPAPSAGAASVVKVDQSVSATQVRTAVDAVKSRATAFKGKVSDAALRAIVGR